MIKVVVRPDAIELPVGAVVRVPGTWQDYQTLLEHLGDRTCPRVKYRQGELLLMVPLPEHGKQLDINPETTMTLPEQFGITPDHFFYIGELPVVGQRRIDWSTDPPPDLAIESDITSFTNPQDYLPYRVSELWLVRQQKLKIYQLQGVQYTLVQQSRFFSGFDLNAIFEECIKDAYQLGSDAIDRLSDRYPRKRS